MARRTARDKQLSNLIDQFQPQIRAAYLEAIQGVKDQVILGEVITAITDGDPIRAFEVLGFNQAAMRPLTAMIENAYETGGVFVASTLPPMPTSNGGRSVFRFDVRNSRAEKWLRDYSSNLVTRITSEQLGAVRNVISEGVQAGRNPRNIGLDIVGRIDPKTGKRAGGIVGLSAPQERYVSNARAELASGDTNYFTRARRDKRFDPIVRKSIDTGVPLDTATVDKLAGRYSDSLLQLRGETIGRTEALTSLNQSQHEAVAQAVDGGGLQASQVVRVWDSSGPDGRTREDHLEMDGQAVGVDEAFTAPDGSRLMYPGDTSLGADPSETINCRCKVRLQIDFLVDNSASDNVGGFDGLSPDEAALFDKAQPVDGEAIYAMNAGKVNTLLQQTAPDYYIDPQATDNFKLNRAKGFLDGSRDFTAPSLGLNIDNSGQTNIGFTDGRHRFAAMVSKGLSTVPVSMEPGSVKVAKKLGLVVSRSRR